MMRRLWGLDRVAEIISNGTDAPGTLLSKCSQEFLKIFNSADVVIATRAGQLRNAQRRTAKSVFSDSDKMFRDSAKIRV